MSSLFGSVERVADQIVELSEMDLKHLLFLLDFGNMPRAAARTAVPVQRDGLLTAPTVLPISVN